MVLSKFLSQNNLYRNAIQLTYEDCVMFLMIERICVKGMSRLHTYRVF